MSSAIFPPERVRLSYWGYAEGTPDIHIPPHSHDCWQANFTLSGRCIMQTDEGEFPLSGSDMIFIAPGVRHSLSYTEPYLSYSCKFRTDRSDLPRVVRLSDNDFTRGAIQAAKVILETTFPKRFFGVPEGTIILPQDDYQLLMEHFLTGVLAVFSRQHEHTGILKRFYAEQEKQGRPFFSVEEAAAACGYSRNHFSLLIRRQTGQNARDFLNRLRLESARRFLRYSDRSLCEISACLGFSSQFHFTDFFKRMTGISPTQYRKKESDKNG